MTVLRIYWTQPQPWSPKVPDALRVLIMRPVHQSEPLMRACRLAGFDPISLPTLEIQPVVLAPLANTPASSPAGAPSQGLAIFTSVNAVLHADQLAPLPWPVPAIGIGPATHAALKHRNQETAWPPAAPYTSESLARRLLDGHSINRDTGVNIITGENGRGHLADQLERSGFPVSVHAVYRRRLPDHDHKVVQGRLDPVPDIICVPSNQALDNLLTLAGDAGAALRDVPLVLNSERAAEHARKCGFRAGMLVACAAGDQGQLQALSHWRDEQHTSAG